MLIVSDVFFPLRSVYNAPQTPIWLGRGHPPQSPPLSPSSASSFPVGPRLCGVRSAHQMVNHFLLVYNTAYIGNIAYCLSGSGYKMACHGNEISDKIGNNSACVRDILEILQSNRGFSGSNYRLISVKFYDDRWLP